MPQYPFKCAQCAEEAVVECKMSQKKALWPQCPEHGDSMEYQYTNTNKHTDRTTYRKGFFGSDEEGWRQKGKKK